MKCSNCAGENPLDAKFCDNCGAPLERTCSLCGTLNQPTAKFCKQCGTNLDSPAREVSPRQVNSGVAVGEASRDQPSATRLSKGKAQAGFGVRLFDLQQAAPK